MDTTRFGRESATLRRGALAAAALTVLLLAGCALALSGLRSHAARAFAGDRKPAKAARRSWRPPSAPPRQVSGSVASSAVARPRPAGTTAAGQRTVETSGAKVVALTFDDGPWPGQTEQVLAILQRARVRATFFEIGEQVSKRPQLSRMLSDAGMLVANHTATHPNLSKMDARHIDAEILGGETRIRAATGTTPRFLRPPGGDTNRLVWSEASRLKVKVVQWDVDTEDWQKPHAATIVSRVMMNVRPGSVVLMHDGGGGRSRTIEALPTVIRLLKAEGYRFVTVDQLRTLPK
jgi:peptidoglycan/xylan/chitin deacetylase (PgdA/CDA1 family)